MKKLLSIHMKNIFLALSLFLIAMAVQSCDSCDEYCGIIIDDPLVTDADGNLNYGLTIENDCSGNSKTFYFTEDVWMNNFVDDYFCVENVSSWKLDGNVIEVDSLRIKKESMR